MATRHDETDTLPDEHEGEAAVERRRLAEWDTAVIRATVGLDEIGPWVGAAFGRAAAVLAAQCLEPAGPPFVRYSPQGDGRFGVEAGFPVHRPVVHEADVDRSTLPACDALVTIHVGPYDQVAEAYERIERFAAEHSLTTAPDPWEVYLTDPSTNHDPATWLTEVVVPLATA